MRSALLPTPGDPFMLAYWLRNFETWRAQVDELVVFVNGQRDPALVQYAQSIVEAAGGRFLASERSAGHDGALLYLLQNTNAEHVVLCEDDAYVRHPDAVGEAFGRIESGQTDLVGSPRHEDYDGQYVRFTPYIPGDLAELRHGLWPAFLFARRADLLATDQRFGDRAWWLGETIEGWGEVTPEACAFVGIGPEMVHLDTLFGTTFQLRAAGLRTELVHHVRLYDAQATEEWLAEDPPWFHVTGLSTLPAVLDGADPVTLPDMDEHGGLWTRRVAWWFVTSKDDRTRMAHLDTFCQRAGVRMVDLLTWSARLRLWVTWADEPVPA